MTGSNHVLAGALIAATVQQPAAAVSLALVSHFVMDALPHYGDSNKHSWLNRHFIYVLLVDGILAVGFIAALLFAQPIGWGLMLTCALVAVAPDAIWLPHYLADLRGQSKQHGRFARFSKWIQWGERPWGIYIEAVVLVAMLTVFIQIVR